MKTARKMPLTRKQLFIMGYSYARNFTAEPQFSIRNIGDAALESGFRTDLSNLYPPAGQLAIAGYLKREESIVPDNDIFAGTTSVKYSYQEGGFEPMIMAIMYGVRRLGNTLPEMLRLQCSVEAVVEHAAIFNRLQHDLLQQSGQPVSHK